MATLGTATRIGSILVTMALLLLGGSPAFARADEKRDTADQRMLKTLEEIRLRQVEMKDGRYDLEGAAAAYAQAFREYGIDLLAQKPEKAAEVIRARAIHLALAVALDDWAFLTRDREKRERLSEVARRADPDPWRNRLRAALSEKDVKALHKLAAAEAVKEQSPTTLVMLGRGLAQAGAVNEAVALLREAQRLHPADFWITFTLADLFSRLGPPRQEEAVGYYRAALALRPKSPAVYLNLGAALVGLGRLEEAIACYRRAIDLDPKAAPAHLNLGNALLQKGQLDEAIACYRQALAIDPRAARAHVGLGKVLRSKGRFNEALQAFRSAIELDPQLPFVHRELGLTFFQIGKLDEALAAYRRALTIDPPGDVQTLLGMGDVLMAQGKREEACEVLKRGLKLLPEKDPRRVRVQKALEECEKLRDKKEK
jgi:tetratricopeptide (TPR) repeat protein